MCQAEEDKVGICRSKAAAIMVIRPLSWQTHKMRQQHQWTYVWSLIFLFSLFQLQATVLAHIGGLF